MSLLAKLERRVGRCAIPNLTLLLIVGQVAVYLLGIANGMQNLGDVALLNRLILVGNLVLGGEVWRLITFVFVPPDMEPNGLIFNLIAWFFFFFVGSVMENTWGTFRYNMFLLVGYLATVAAAFIRPEIAASNAFYLSSVFLAFARLYPDYVIRLFYVLPIKAKWLALIQWLGFGVVLATQESQRLVILASVANYLLFFWKEHYRDYQDRRRRATFQAKVTPTTKSGRMLHTCAVCGLSSEDEPRTQFRYCSECAGQKCYCPKHIREHEHVREESAVD